MLVYTVTPPEKKKKRFLMGCRNYSFFTSFGNKTSF